MDVPEARLEGIGLQLFSNLDRQILGNKITRNKIKTHHSQRMVEEMAALIGRITEYAVERNCYSTSAVCYSTVSPLMESIWSMELKIIHEMAAWKSIIPLQIGCTDCYSYE